MNKLSLFIFWIAAICFPFDLSSQKLMSINSGDYTFLVPKEYFTESKNIPEFWITSNDDVARYLYCNVHIGKIEILGKSAGGRLIRAVGYGKSRFGKGTSTFSGSLGYGDFKLYRGDDHEKIVYLGIGGIHGGEFEGIVGMINLISVLETGKDLREKEWPEIVELSKQIDRIVLIPIMNPDGRARIPLKMEQLRDNYEVHEYINTGGYPNGKIIGWPHVKKFIPIDFGNSIFPGGYPNDAGVNIQHDDFFGNRQPETQALFDLCEREKPDLILNMHTGATYPFLDRPLCETVLKPVFDSLYVYIHRGFTLAGLLSSMNIQEETNYENASAGIFNLDAALNFHCGALSVLIESPSHGFSRVKEGKFIYHSPESLLDAQLIAHREAMRFLVKFGGRAKWTLDTR